MMRSGHGQMDPTDILRDAVFSPLDWPWKTMRLERDSLYEYRQRAMSAQISVAELYHENAKLCSEVMRGLVVSRVDADNFRREFVRRRSVAVQAAGVLSLDLDEQWRGVLSGIAKASRQELFYAVEVRLVVDEILAIHEPVWDTLFVVRKLPADDLRLLRQGLQLMDTTGATSYDGLLVFILGCFARNDLLMGPRGYRRTLVEAGQVAQLVLSEAGRQGLAVWPLYEFSDREVDRALEADGTEEGTLMAFMTKGADHVR